MDRLLTSNEVAIRLWVTLRTLGEWRKKGTGPRWILVGGHYRYPESALEAWLTANSGGGSYGPRDPSTPTNKERT